MAARRSGNLKIRTSESLKRFYMHYALDEGVNLNRFYLPYKGLVTNLGSEKSLNINNM